MGRLEQSRHASLHTGTPIQVCFRHGLLRKTVVLLDFGFLSKSPPSPQFGRLVQLFFRRQNSRFENQFKVQIIAILEEIDSYY